MNDQDPSKFTCSNCGGHELIVTHVWNNLAGNDSESWREWGPLKDNHHWQHEFREKIQENADDEVQRGDFGAFEEDDSSSEPEEYETYETETSRESDEFLLNCGNCDREVEFSDFNSLESWPDPKYVDVWQQRGWLRTGYRPSPK